jgi:hypothetical protein
MWRVRKLFRRLRRSVDFDIAQQFTPADTGSSLSLLGAAIPLVRDNLAIVDSARIGS